jgi:hypothetical protein
MPAISDSALCLIAERWFGTSFHALIEQDHPDTVDDFVK